MRVVLIELWNCPLLQPMTQDKKRHAKLAQSKSRNIFTQIQQRATGDLTRLQHRNVPNRFQHVLRTLLCDDFGSVFLCFSRDGLQLISYALSSDSSSCAYKLQFWESPLWPLENRSRSLRKIGEVALFTGCDLREDGDLEPGFEEEKHLHINVTETVCGCFIISGSSFDDVGVDHRHRVFVTIIPPLSRHVTSIHFTYACYGPVTRPTVLSEGPPSPAYSALLSSTTLSSSFILVTNTVDALRTLRIRCHHSDQKIHVLTNVSNDTLCRPTSQFFQTQNWFGDIIAEDTVVDSVRGGNSFLTTGTVISLELEPVLACWLSRQPGPRYILKDYSAICVPGPEVVDDLYAIVVFHADAGCLHDEDENLSVLSMTIGFENHKLSISKLAWSKASLQKVAHMLVPASSARDGLKDMAAAGASLLARQRYLPSSKNERIFHADNTPIFNCRSQKLLVNPNFPIAIVLE